MFNQKLVFFDNLFSINQFGFRKGYSSYQCLLTLSEKWKNTADKGKVFGALLTSLPMAFGCLDHKLLIAKLNAYRFSFPEFKFIHNYLTNRRVQTEN